MAEGKNEGGKNRLDTGMLEDARVAQEEKNSKQNSLLRRLPSERFSIDAALRVRRSNSAVPGSDFAPGSEKPLARGKTGVILPVDEGGVS
jgi:hypothetical protein